MRSGGFGVGTSRLLTDSLGRGSPGAEGGFVCNICPLILTLDSYRGPIWIEKTWVDIPDEGQRGVIQYGVHDGRGTLIPNITPSGSVLE